MQPLYVQEFLQAPINDIILILMKIALLDLLPP